MPAGRREYAAGGRGIATRNDHRLGVVNGEAGVVAAIGRERLTIELDRGRKVELPARYAADGLDHGYAIRATRWYQPGRRAEVERRIEGTLDDQHRSRAEVERLRSDPLAAFEAPARIARERGLERSRDRDVGVER